MPWWAQSLVNSLRGDDDDDEEYDEEEIEEEETAKKNSGSSDKSRIGSSSGAQIGGIETEEEEEEEEGGSPTRGVKEDISEFTKTLTRQFWGVASFLAPAPAPASASESDVAAGNLTADGQSGMAEPLLEDPESPRIAGIRNDFAEISVKFRSGISSVLSHSMAVSEISKIASTILPFGSDEEEDDEEGAIGVSEEVLAFARNVANHPETWMEFPLPHGEEYSDDFQMSDTQLEHALAIERLAPEFASLRGALCPTQMSEGCFWKIYFVLLHSRLNRDDAELLSTPQVVEARAMLLQDLHIQTKTGSDRLVGEASFRNDDVTTIPIEEDVVEPSSTATVTAPPAALSSREPISGPSNDIGSERHHAEPTARDYMKDVETEKYPIQLTSSGSVEDDETEKHPVQTTEVKIVDKSVIEEKLADQNKGKDICSQSSKDSVRMYEEDGDDWLEDDTGETSTAKVAASPLGHDEDVSFSDLEDDNEDSGPSVRSKTISVDSQLKDSRGRNQLSEDTEVSVNNSTNPKTNVHNDWLDIEDFDIE